MTGCYLVDSSVLLSFLNQSEDCARARDLLLRAHAAGFLVYNGVVAAEVGAHFKTADEFRLAMEAMGLHYFDFREETALVAGRLWRKFRQAGGKRRDRIIADFLIAASGMECAALVTLDQKFPRVSGLAVFQ